MLSSVRLPFRVVLRAALPAAALFAAGTRPAAGAAVAPAAETRPGGGLRELRTDRPDATESPFTVDAGHTQLELDFAAVLRDRQQGVRTTAVDVAPFNLRFGLTPSFEAGIFLSPWQQEAVTPPGGPRETRRGVGDSVLRAKWNFRGNDHGALGLGLIADVKLPTARRGLGNGKIEPALTVPVAYDFGGGWEGGAMTTLNASHLGARGYRATWGNTATLGRELAENLGGYVELTSLAGDGPHVATFNLGLTRALDANTQLDGGANVGLSRRAPDLLVFAGLSRRF
jgi:hypothetical protein